MFCCCKTEDVDSQVQVVNSVQNISKVMNDNKSNLKDEDKKKYNIKKVNSEILADSIIKVGFLLFLFYIIRKFVYLYKFNFFKILKFNSFFKLYN
jgi:hypothetical protein